MKATGGIDAQSRVLEGKFVRVLRSSKGKLKGLQLQTGDGEYSIKLPKYLRPMLLRELEVGSVVRVWVSPKKDDWVALNVIPLDPKVLEELEPLPKYSELPQQQASNRPQVCVQVCRKGNCCKRGSGEVYQKIETAIATNPALENIRLESTGCLKECKRGPALKISPTKEVLTHVTPENVEAILEKQCSQLSQVSA